MNIYIASRFANSNQVQCLRDAIHRETKHRCIQTWADGDQATPVLAAQVDLEQIDAADMVLVYTKGCEMTPGGMHFETGYAYARGKQIVLIGPPTNVFHTLPNIRRFPSSPEFFEVYG
jgi:nucleoside 2-deoxyribosyltransferase